jgi:hypothetical protein
LTGALLLVALSGGVIPKWISDWRGRRAARAAHAVAQ